MYVNYTGIKIKKIIHQKNLFLLHNNIRWWLKASNPVGWTFDKPLITTSSSSHSVNSFSIYLLGVLSELSIVYAMWIHKEIMFLPYPPESYGWAGGLVVMWLTLMLDCQHSNPLLPCSSPVTLGKLNCLCLNFLTYKIRLKTLSYRIIVRIK